MGSGGFSLVEASISLLAAVLLCPLMIEEEERGMESEEARV